MKTGIIDVGGGFRDIYGAGVIDACLAQGIRFDYCIGISAGSANLISYLSQQPRRSYTFYMEYVFRKEYASLGKWLRTRNYIDLDYSYGTLSNSDGENPIDYETLEKSPAEFYVGACEAATGKPFYFDKSFLAKDRYDVLKASCALPLFCKPYVIDGKAYLDGGVSDPVPVDKALADGCDRGVLILTRPVGQLRQPGKDRLVAGLLARSCPAAAQRMRMRYKAYNDGVARARALAAQGRVLIVAPDDIRGLSTLTRDREQLERLSEKGVSDAGHIEAFLQSSSDRRSHPSLPERQKARTHPERGAAGLFFY